MRKDLMTIKMIKTFKVIIGVSLILFLFTGCTDKGNASQRQEFFAWMDSYLAVEQNVENSIAVTLFFEHAPYSTDEIASISFVGIQDQVVINDFRVETMGLPDPKYSAYVVTLTYTAKENGIFQTPGIRVTLKSNEEIQYPIGDWTFDIGKSGDGKVDTWGSPVVTSNGTQFPYIYSLKNSTGIIKKIYYGDKLFIENEHGISSEGSIDLKGYSSPIVFIKSKIVFSEDGKEFIDYGKGCYCGAVGFSEEVVEKSKIHNAIKM
jgi:hypothetical protein